MHSGATDLASDLESDSDLVLDLDPDSDLDSVSDSGAAGFRDGAVADGPAPSAFVLPPGSLGSRRLRLALGGRGLAGRSCPVVDPVLAALAGLALLAFGLPRLWGRRFVASFAFGLALRPEPAAVPPESPDREGSSVADEAVSSE